MASKFGGGGSPCTICTKTVYPAETILYEKKPYHSECFRCSECDKKTTQTKCASYENKLFCKPCFVQGGYAQKQRNVKWTKKETTGTAVASKFGGGGTICPQCDKRVYPAEAISYEKQMLHVECLKCSNCDKKTSPSSTASYEGKLFCTLCFDRGGYTQKQRQVKWTPKEGGGNAVASKFGGGGLTCFICTKTVYNAEAIQYEKKVFHEECFKCTDCSKKVTPSKAGMFEDKVYCDKCFSQGGYREKQMKQGVTEKKPVTYSAKFSKFGGGGNKCKVCAKTVYPAETVSFEKDSYHVDCFTCNNCNSKMKPIAAEYKKVDGKVENIWCKKCFLELGLNRA